MIYFSEEANAYKTLMYRSLIGSEVLNYISYSLLNANIDINDQDILVSMKSEKIEISKNFFHNIILDGECYRSDYQKIKNIFKQH